MSSNQVILVNNSNAVDIYSVRFSSQLKKIQKKIDDWNGKGEIKTQIAFSLLPIKSTNHIEEISRTYSGSFYGYGYCGQFGEQRYYEFTYYEYEPHPLSQLCDKLIESSNPLEVSETVKSLLEWEAKTEEEKTLLRNLLRSISFEKLVLNRINYLKRIQTFLTIKRQLRANNNDNRNKSKLLETLPTTENIGKVA